MRPIKEPTHCEFVEVIRATDDALLVYDGCERWIPKSQICEESEINEHSTEGESGTLVLPEWLAIDKGFV